MSFDGDLYPTAGATSVMNTKGDMVDFDTIRQRLAIGSANQILQVKSSLPSWQTVPLADTVLTTAGDILYENATPALARLASGTQYNTLQMGATLPAWSASATSTMSGTGDVLYSSGANTLARLAIGSTDDVLTVAGGVPTWASAGGGGAWASEGNDVNTSPATSLDVTVSDQDVYQVLYNVSDGGGDYNALVMRINDDDGATTYKALLSQGVASGGSQSDPELTTQDKCMITGESIERQCNGTIYVYKGDSNFRSGNAGVSYTNQGIQNSTSDPYNWQIGGGTFSSLTSAITKISLLFMKTTTTANENIEGSMRVNSLSYS